MMSDVRLVHSQKQPEPKVVRVLGREMEGRLLQLWKQLASMLVTDSGTLMEVSPVQ